MKKVSMSDLEYMYGRKSGVPRDDLSQFEVSDLVIRDILLEEVADLIWDMFEEYISSEVYGAYEPKRTYYGKHPPKGWVPTGRTGEYVYQRRYDLNDRDSMVEKILGVNTLFVTSDAQPNESVIGSGWSGNTGGFLQMIGTNPGSLWKGKFPRPVIEKVQEAIDNNPRVQRALSEAFNIGLSRYIE